MDEYPPGVAPTPVPPPAVPGLTGLTVLARGGYATIYQAVQESVGRDVAVKIENRSLASDHDKRRFLREARAAGRMSSHPHVVDLFDAGVTADDHPYLIMELCAGSYADRIRCGPLGPAEVRDVGVKIADALADAHDLGVLHRDVKPANILVTGFGEPALADFGLAVLAEARDVSTTLDVLTPAYAPREMFRSAEPSPAADVYSLCATLYALLRSKPPRWQDDRNPSLITLIELFERPIPDLPGVPSHLLDLLRAGMCNDPAARPSARELGERLAAVPMPADSAPKASDAASPERSVGTMVGGSPDVWSPDVWSLPTQPRPVAPGSAALAAEGLPAEGLPAEGLPAEGLAAEGLAAEGLAVGGLAADGLAVGGLAVGGLAVGGLAADGLAAGGLAVGGLAVGGLAADGLAAGGLAADGLSAPAGPAASDAGSVGAGVDRAGSAGSAAGGTAPADPAASDGSGESDPERTVPVHRRGWPFAAAGAVLVLGLLAAGSWYGISHGWSSGRSAHAVAATGRGRPTPSGRESSSAVPSRGAPSGRASQGSGGTAPVAAGSCVLGMFGAACPSSAQCFDQLAASGEMLEAKSLPCLGPHTWEVFALGTLPPELASVGYQAIRGSQSVARLCNPATLTLVDLQAARWQIEVLPPTPTALASGDRTFRCLAGTGRNQQSTSLFGSH